MSEELTELLTINEAAARIRMPVATLRHWRHCGTGPTSIKLGRRVMYRVIDLEAWIDGLAHQAGSSHRVAG